MKDLLCHAEVSPVGDGVTLNQRSDMVRFGL